MPYCSQTSPSEVKNILALKEEFSNTHTPVVWVGIHYFGRIVNCQQTENNTFFSKIHKSAPNCRILTPKHSLKCFKECFGVKIRQFGADL